MKYIGKYHLFGLKTILLSEKFEFGEFVMNLQFQIYYQHTSL